MNTVTLADPVAAISEAGIIAVNCVPETKTVGRSTPFHCTTELKMKLEPLTVSVSPAPPAVAVFGERPVNDGADGACAKAPGANSPQIMIAAYANLAARRLTDFNSFPSSIALGAIFPAPSGAQCL